MNAILYHPTPTQNGILQSAPATKGSLFGAAQSPIAVMPSQERYFEAMAQLLAEVYDIKPDEGTVSADYFRSQAAHFPEGQFIAVDCATDRVVGLTSSMRMDFNPHAPLLESWYTTTNYG